MNNFMDDDILNNASDDLLDNILKSGFDDLGLPLYEGAVDRFMLYHNMLEAQNRVMNLTAIYGIENVARLHFLDCCAVLRSYDFSGKSVIDIGSGAGFPGIPMKIAMPDLDITLLDSQNKRVQFLSEVCRELGMQEVSCVHARAEEYLQINNLREGFHAVVSRAVSNMSMLCELCLPYVAVGGAMVAMKGPDCEQELSQAASAIEILGGDTPIVHRYNIPGTDISHCIVVVNKIKKTPDKYPRRFAKIQKNPL